jgi:putative ABC transport system permease protein
VRNVSGVRAVVPTGEVPISGLVVAGRTIGYNQLTATTPAFFDVRPDAEFIAGRAFESGAAEVVINEAALALFEENVSIGERVVVVRPDGTRVNATLVGVAETGGGFFDGSSFPEVYVPTDPFYQNRLESPAEGDEQRVYPSLTVVATEFRVVEDVEQRLLTYLQTDSDARYLVPDSYGFAVQTPQDLVDQIQNLLSTFTTFVTGIAVISLVVGSIGIANIMLVSVTERTREIGIMKATGAQNRDILQLFLVEAVVLGVVGAVVGTVLGVVGGYVATWYVELPLTFPAEWAGIAVVVGVLVGVLAGLYPAWDAARTDPIDALRYE